MARRRHRPRHQGLFVLRRPRRTRASYRALCGTQRFPIEPFKKNSELTHRHGYARCARRYRERNPVGTPVESLVQNAVAGPIVPKQLQMRTSPVMKHDESLHSRIGTELLAHDPGKSIEGEM